MWAVLGSLCFLLASGAVFEWQYSKHLQQRFPPPGVVLELGAERIHLDVLPQMDRTKNNPTIVFLAGLGNSPLAFDWVIEELDGEYRTIAFDRPGTGWSHESTLPPTAGYAADVLSEALTSLEIHEPVVLVAHSYGGIVARIFASRYPNKVLGIVLVDSSHEDQIERLPGGIGVVARLMMHKATVQKWAARFGLLRLPHAVADEGIGLPQASQAAFDAITAGAQNRAGSQAEAAHWVSSQQQAREARSLGDLPVRVLVADQWPKAMLPTWLSMQHEIASWSSNSSVEILEGANHVSVIYSKTYSVRVSQVIRELSSKL